MGCWVQKSSLSSFMCTFHNTLFVYRQELLATRPTPLADWPSLRNYPLHMETIFSIRSPRTLWLDLLIRVRTVNEERERAICMLVAVQLILAQSGRKTSSDFFFISPWKCEEGKLLGGASLMTRGFVNCWWLNTGPYDIHGSLHARKKNCTVQTHVITCRDRKVVARILLIIWLLYVVVSTVWGCIITMKCDTLWLTLWTLRYKFITCLFDDDSKAILVGQRQNYMTIIINRNRGWTETK